MNVKEKKFIKFVKSECKLYGIKCDLRNTKSVKFSEESRCSGYFDEDAKVLICAMKQEDGLSILVHEYCHLTQWVENIDIWKKAVKSLPLVWDWLSGIEVKNINKHIAVARELELDNEKRAVKLIKHFDLNIDIRTYIRKANAYVLFYNYMAITRRWSKPKNSPYTNKVLVKAMSPKFNMGYEKMNPKIEKIFKQENI